MIGSACWTGCRVVKHVPVCSGDEHTTTSVRAAAEDARGQGLSASRERLTANLCASCGALAERGVVKHGRVAAIGGVHLPHADVAVHFDPPRHGHQGAHAVRRGCGRSSLILTRETRANRHADTVRGG